MKLMQVLVAMKQPRQKEMSKMVASRVTRPLMRRAPVRHDHAQWQPGCR